MALQITADKTTYASGDTAQIVVTRDPNVPPPSTPGGERTVHTISFLETAADGSTVDTGSIDLTVVAPGGDQESTTITASSDTLTVTAGSDDGTTANFSVVLP